MPSAIDKELAASVLLEAAGADISSDALTESRYTN
jgi:hypothetical protein